MATKLKAQKVRTADVDGFTETVKFKVLFCGNPHGNNNKFYCLEHQRDPKTDEHRLFTHYGRLGKTDVYEVRGPGDESVVESEFNRILKQKSRTRKDSVTKKEYRYEEVDTFAPTVGSPNIRNKSAPTHGGSAKPDFSEHFDESDVVEMLQEVWEENIHNITSVSSVTMTANGLETPLGPVTKRHLKNARAVLDKIRKMQQGSASMSDLTKWRNIHAEYYSLIPHPFGSKIPDNAFLDDHARLFEEYELLDQMESAIQIQKKPKAQKTDLPFKMKLVTDMAVFDKISEVFESSRAGNHHGLRDWTVAQIFEIEHPTNKARYDKKGKPLGNVKELWHGSRNCNILSILMNGLIIPPVNAGHVTGRMFGNGVYAASASTKALNYSVGYWSGRRNKYDSAYMFIVQFAMGKCYESHDPMHSGAPAGYDSVWGKKGRSLYNDEYIVYSLEQVRITHLVKLGEL